MKITKQMRAVFAEVGRMGGKARAKALTPARRSDIAKHAAQQRWKRRTAMKTAVALVLLLAAPLHAEPSKFSRFAPIGSWIGCQMFDGITTAIALHNPQLREANPLLRGPALFPLKLSLNLGVFVGHQQISARHPKLRFFAPLVMASSGCLAGVLNTRTIRSVR